MPLPSTEIAIRDDDGNESAARRGRRNLHPGTAGDGGLLEPAGRDRQGDDKDGYFKSGDMGFMDERRATPRSSTARRT
jgi:long-chain acyl-CoA synthetase